MPAESRPPAIERELQFSCEDLEEFAAAAGDRNPLHIDPGFARRTPFGSCLVHGALVTIGMLGTVPPDELARIRSVRVRFSGPVLPGASCRVRAERSRRSEGAWDVSLTGRGKVLARVQAARSREPTQAALRAAESLPPTPEAGMAVRAMRTTPAALNVSELPAGHSFQADYATGAALSEVAARFGAETLIRAVLDGLAWASYVVGMELPGLHSLFGGLVLAASEASEAAWPAARQTIRLRDYDARTGQLIIDGVLRDRAGAPRSVAVIDGFARVPVGAPDLEALAATPASGQPGRTVVVIGGSRGFGASISLALLARGYSVHIVHSTLWEGSEELVRATGPHGVRLHLHQCDARNPDAIRALAASVRESEGGLTGLVLNAAVPPLPMTVTADSGSELAAYVEESVRLAAVPLGSFVPLLDAEGAWVLFSSSSYVCAPPRDWPHYVTAKAALEGLARWLSTAMPSVLTVIVRPPPMRTEWTNTPSARISAVPTETVATWVVDKIVGHELPVGLSVLEPDGLGVAAQ